MTYTLIHGDCLKEMDRIEAGSVDMILADLPFNTTACVWDKLIPFEPLWAQYKRILKKRGACILFGSQPFTSLLVVSNLEWFKYEWIWEKHRGTNIFLVKNMPLKIHEECLLFCEGNPKSYNPQMTNGKPYKLRGIHNIGKGNALLLANKPVGYASGFDSSKRYPTSIQKFSNHNQLKGSLHPTQKPVSLLKYLILTYSNEGDTILDNTMGSGSTGEAALRTNRHFIGIELYPLPDRPIGDDNPDYFGIAQRRLDDVARELRGEWKPLNGNGHKLDDLPLFEGLSAEQAALFSEAAT